ncbi:xylose isomerase TIM barrel domain-containing protein [Octadecabacter arcticus 238]|uniref:Xylose isomerase TIM barrel domain-containing protein n=2 Tax=Octadecabacter arcticus TaxID=53946 RepID=M9RQY0_9RHOB|nr:xylose isomerase TIM barrel domain-containing protein [Octadecabacter arcticus 238]
MTLAEAYQNNADTKDRKDIMKLGLGSYAYRWSIGINDQFPTKPLDAFDLLDRAEALGLEVVQYADNMPLDRYSEADHHRLYEVAQVKGLTLELGTQCFDAEEVDRYLKIGQRLHSKIMRVALDEADGHISVSELAELLRPRIDKARAAGMKIAIENHFNYPSARMIELLDKVNDDHLGVCLDVANSICANEWPEETIAMLAPYTINLHLKDYEITPDKNGVGFRIHGVLLGQGRAPIDWTLDMLKHCPADMSVILEHWLMIDDEGLDVAVAKEQPWIEQTVLAAKDYVKGR